MIKVVGIRFKPGGKVYFFDPLDLKINKDDYVIVDTVRGKECGLCVKAPHNVSKNSIVKALKAVEKIATSSDIAKLNKNKEDEKKAFSVCEEKILAHKLNMKLIDVEYTFDRGKILFYFTSDARVDFRELVKDLASVFKTRIELRQIGVRDESRMLNGVGICGQTFCCSRFLGDFTPVSIKMAKEQNLSLNPTKISGSCGRLMCCLSFEQDTYEYLNKMTPSVGSLVKTEDGNGIVTESMLLKGKVKVRLDKNREGVPREYEVKSVQVLKKGRNFVDKQVEAELKKLED